MSKESLDYLKLCPNYYTNWEDGCCMENCTFNDLGECPIHYVKGLLEEKDKAIENWQTMYQSVVQTCYNDKEEIERLNKQLETQENTITNLVEDNRASQEWYKKQIADTEAQNKRVLEKLDFIVRSNQELEKENELMAKTLKITKFVEKEVDQDKISFCIERLEKVKEKLRQNITITAPEGELKKLKDYLIGVDNFIDNQINVLRNNKDGIH